MQFIPTKLGGNYGVSLDISELSEEDQKRMTPYLTFNVKTYRVLSEEGYLPDRFRTVGGATNWYMEHADPDCKLKIARFFAIVNQMIATEMVTITESRQKFSEFITKLGEMYAVIVDECHLREEFYKYAEARVQLQDISTYGSRPQDSKELTFSVAEMCDLMNLAFLIKFVAPIFGELIFNIPDNFDSEGNKKLNGPNEKDIKVVGFMRPIIDKYYLALDDKLQFFIEHIVNTQLKSNINTAAAIFAGLIPAKRVECIRAAILVRNFVCCELERSDSNIVRFVDTMIHSHLTSQANFSNRNQVRLRRPIASFGAGEDSDNTAQMETDSVVSNRPLDTAIIVESAVDRVVDDFLITFQITHDEMNQCYNYLMKHPVVPSPLNRFVTCAIVGNVIGGGRGIEMLERGPFTKLVCVLQMVAFHHAFYEFGHMLTAGRTDSVRVLKSDDEVKFELNYGTSYIYRTCRDKFSSYSKASDGKEWDKQMKDICDSITQNCYVYNTPDFILDQLGDKFTGVNGDPIPVEVEIINEACTMIDMFK